MRGAAVVSLVGDDWLAMSEQVALLPCVVCYVEVIESSTALLADTSALSEACALLIRAWQTALRSAHVGVRLQSSESFAFRAASAKRGEQQLFKQLSVARDDNIVNNEEFVLNDASLSSVCTVHLRDLRRLVYAGGWPNDQCINALLAIIVNAACNAAGNGVTLQCDAFSSLLVQKLPQLTDDKERCVRFATRYQSMRGHSFEYLLANKIVSCMFVVLCLCLCTNVSAVRVSINHSLVNSAQRARVRMRTWQPILLPRHSRESHWSLLIDAAKSAVWHIDSMNDGSNVLPNRTLMRRLLTAIGAAHYEIEHMKSAQQRDGASCGVYVALNAWKLTRRMALLGAPRVTRAVLARCIVRNPTAPLDAHVRWRTRWTNHTLNSITKTTTSAGCC